MNYRDCLAYIAQRWTDELVVTSAGTSSELWYEITGDTERVFYLEASMSLSTLFAAGIAHGVPEREVWAFSGDGAFAMNPGMLMMERQMNLPNLKHFMVSNRALSIRVNRGAVPPLEIATSSGDRSSTAGMMKSQYSG